MPNNNALSPANSKGKEVEGVFYTKLARFIAFIGILIGIFIVVAGFAEESVVIIGMGLSALLGSVIIGVLTDISMSLAKAQVSSTPDTRRGAPPSDPEERRKWANREPPYD
jgi:hypothetical protein